jgi:hypothetical protein
MLLSQGGLGKPFAIFGVPMSAPATDDNNNKTTTTTFITHNNSININAFSLRRQHNGDKKGTI